jgi:phage shock protein PspC (stress-responsive transcriptional regulator)
MDTGDHRLHDAGMDTPTTTQHQQTSERLTRPAHGRLIAGVAAAFAAKLDIDVALVRLGFVAASFFGGFGLAVYLAAWILLPNEGETTSAAERWFGRTA